MNNVVYNRRRELFTRSRSSYITASLSTTASLDSDEDCSASTSSVSAKSSKSLKSYKSWKRSQRQKRRNLKKSKSVGVEPTSTQMIEALDLSGEHRDVGRGPSRADQQQTALQNADVKSSVHAERQLPAIAQSPLEPYYSSSPLTSSDDSESRGSQQRIQSEIDEIGTDEDLDEKREPYDAQKDPLQRRTYPFIVEEDLKKTPGRRVKRSLTDLYMIPPPVLISEEHTTSLPIDIAGLNDIKKLQERPEHSSLLSLSKLKDKTLAMDQRAYEEEDTGEKDVFFSDQNDFTISLPAHSPTVTPHSIVEGEVKFPTPGERVDSSDGPTDDSDSKDGAGDKKELKRESSTDRSYESPLNTEENRQRLRSLEKLPDADVYFLPPLIAKAITKKAISEEIDKNANLRLSPVPSQISTEEGSEGENVYMENADDFFDDLEEKEFTQEPRKVAMPEEFSDTGSVTTRGSVDPIENILTVKHYEKADDKTFTLNGRAVITPKSGNTLEPQKGGVSDEKKDGTEPITTRVEEEVRPTNAKKQDHAAPKVQEAAPEQKKKTKPIHSHRVGDDRKCDVCNPKNDVSDMWPDCCAIL